METQLKELVIKEAVNLRVHATQAELGRLSFDSLAPNYYNGCVYGQMTGSCDTGRAVALIENSCAKVYKFGTNKNDFTDGATLNGPPKGRTRGFNATLSYYSPIELFILKNEDNGTTDNNLPLIQFLKGEITETEFKNRL